MFDISKHLSRIVNISLPSECFVLMEFQDSVRYYLCLSSPSPVGTIINFKHFNDRSPIKIKAQLEEELHNKFYALIKSDEKGQNVQYSFTKTNDKQT